MVMMAEWRVQVSGRKVLYGNTELRTGLEHSAASSSEARWRDLNRHTEL